MLISNISMNIDLMGAVFVSAYTLYILSNEFVLRPNNSFVKWYLIIICTLYNSIFHNIKHFFEWIYF